MLFFQTLSERGHLGKDTTRNYDPYLMAYQIPEEWEPWLLDSTINSPYQTAKHSDNRKEHFLPLWAGLYTLKSIRTTCSCPSVRVEKKRQDDDLWVPQGKRCASYVFLVCTYCFFPYNTSELPSRSLAYLCFFFEINTEHCLGGRLWK